MDSRFFWLMLILLVGLMGWSYLMPTPSPQPQNPTIEAAATATPAEPVTAVTQSTTPKTPDVPAATRQITVTTPNYVATFDERGGRLASFELTDYKKRKTRPEQASQFMNLVTMPNPDDWPMRLSMSDPNVPDLTQAPFISDQDSLTINAGQTGQILMSYKSPEGLAVTRQLSFSADSFLIGQQIILENNGPKTYGGVVTMRLNTAPFTGKAGYYDEMGAYINNEMITDTADSAADALEDFRGKLTSVAWIGYMDQYFLTALVPGSLLETSESTDVPPSLSAHYQDHGGLAVNASQPVSLASNQKSVYNFNFYYGPKSNEALIGAGHDLIDSVDLGWFSLLAAPLASLLRWIYTWVGNYGVAIIIVTILIKILLWPLTAKSYRSMKEMQKLQPKVLKLREKYADDKETMNKEIMQLYKVFKVNPLGGCLPMLLQIPFFIAFYRVLDSMLELRGAPFVLWIQDLAAPDRLFSFNFTIPFYEPPTGIPVLTLLMGASMILQQKMTPNTMGDPLQAKIMMMMPVVFTVILINMPSGLVLYWLVNNVLSIAQQKIINRDKTPTPTLIQTPKIKKS